MPESINSLPARRFSPRRVLPYVLALFLLVYFVDLAWYQAHLWFPKLGPANGSVHRIRLLAIASRGNKVQYEIDSVTPEEDVPCTHSLFPHSAKLPCWYMARHAKDPIPM